MKEKTVVEIFCDGNPIIGFGHIRRSIALANFLNKQNISVKLSGLSEDATKYLPQSDYINGKTQICVFDSMIGIDSRIAEAKKKGKITVTLDWFGDTVPDINIVVFPHQEVKALKMSYVGFENIIIRDEILSLKPKKQNTGWQNVIVSLGGADLLKQSYQVAELLCKLDYKVTVVQGPLTNPSLTTKSFHVLHNPRNFPEILNSCDWAVTNGAGCLFETLFLGKPTFVLPQTPFEWRITNFVGGKKAILGAGIENVMDFSNEEFEAVSKNGMNLIDGQGLRRIYNIIKELL